MKVIYEWEISDRLNIDKVIDCIFPKHLHIYLKGNIKNIEKLRIRIRKNKRIPKYDDIVFSESEGQNDIRAEND